MRTVDCNKSRSRTGKAERCSAVQVDPEGEGMTVEIQHLYKQMKHTENGQKEASEQGGEEERKMNQDDACRRCTQKGQKVTPKNSPQRGNGFHPKARPDGALLCAKPVQ